MGVPFYKAVLMPIEVCTGDYCWNGIDRICTHFDNEGGHGTCGLDMGPIKRDKEGYYPKPKECLVLVEITEVLANSLAYNSRDVVKRNVVKCGCYPPDKCQGKC